MQYDLSLDKYWVIQCIILRIGFTVLMVTGMTYSKLPLCHDISGNDTDK